MLPQQDITECNLSMPHNSVATLHSIELVIARSYAKRQVVAAREVRDQIHLTFLAANHLVNRACALLNKYENVVQWRCGIAMEAHPGLRSSHDSRAEHLRKPVTNDSTNYDRFGEVAFLREGSKWDSDLEMQVGQSTVPRVSLSVGLGGA